MTVLWISLRKQVAYLSSCLLESAVPCVTEALLSLAVAVQRNYVIVDRYVLSAHRMSSVHPA